MAIPRWRFQLINALPVSKRIRIRMRASLVSKAFEKDILAAKTENDPDTVAGIESSASFELSQFSDAEASLVTHQLRKRASKLGVAEPILRIVDGVNVDRNWYRSDWTGEWILSAQGTRRIRRRIREEQKARAELRALYIPWLAAITGLMTAVVAILALLSGKR
jgi:hypothetical protein